MRRDYNAHRHTYAHMWHRANVWHDEIFTVVQTTTMMTRTYHPLQLLKKQGLNRRALITLMKKKTLLTGFSRNTISSGIENNATIIRSYTRVTTFNYYLNVRIHIIVLLKKEKEKYRRFDENRSWYLELSLRVHGLFAPSTRPTESSLSFISYVYIYFLHNLSYVPIFYIYNATTR